MVAALQIWLGDGLGRVVAHDQPAALAAMEGHYNTLTPTGQPNTGWHVVAWPNAKGDGTVWAITIPHVLSLLETHSWNGTVPGLNDFPKDQRPPVVIPFYAFRAMVAIGGVLFLVALWAAWLAVRGRLSVERIASNRWFLRALIVSGFLPYLAVWTGWWTREIARQPWVVYGLMRTRDGVSHLSAAAAIFWLVGFMLFELMVWGGAWYFFAKVIRRGPDLDSPIPAPGTESLGHLETDPDEDEEAGYFRPV